MPHTHKLTYEGPVLAKRYPSWARGEHRREWTMLLWQDDLAFARRLTDGPCPAPRRNPPGTADDQATRLLNLLD